MINYYYLPGVRVFLTIQLIFQLNFRFVLNYTENLCITIRAHHGEKLFNPLEELLARMGQLGAQN